MTVEELIKDLQGMVKIGTVRKSAEVVVDASLIAGPAYQQLAFKIAYHDTSFNRLFLKLQEE